MVLTWWKTILSMPRICPTGIYLNYCQATPGSEATIANNLISVEDQRYLLISLQLLPEYLL